MIKIVHFPTRYTIQSQIQSKQNKTKNKKKENSPNFLKKKLHDLKNKYPKSTSLPPLTHRHFHIHSSDDASIKLEFDKIISRIFRTPDHETGLIGGICDIVVVVVVIVLASIIVPMVAAAVMTTVVGVFQDPGTFNRARAAFLPSS
jgi:hypothetical protein